MIRTGKRGAPWCGTRLRLIVGLFALALTTGLGAAMPAHAAVVYTRFDFESRGYGGLDRRITDHFLLRVDSTWHLFYTELVTPRNPVCRIGHAVSSDLFHWTERPPVLQAGTQDWMATGVWAPHVVPNPGGGWAMLFTGRNDFGAQVIGLMTSGDLDHWQLAPENPVWIPPATWARWGETFANSCRDPFLYFESGSWSMLYTVATAAGRPAIGRAESIDLVHWEDRGPLVVDDSPTPLGELESPALSFVDGRAELFYTQSNLRVVEAPASAGPWSLATARILDPRGGAGEVVETGSGRILSRVRYDYCGTTSSLVVIDSLVKGGENYALSGVSTTIPEWRATGGAFSRGPVFGDGPAWRGQIPASPKGVRWVSSAERHVEPGGSTVGCSDPPDDQAIGSLRSPRFVLRGDSLHFRVMGAASPDSAYVALLDACTGATLERRTGTGGTALTPAAWPVGSRRGWPVQLELVDRLVRPGGSIGLDDVCDSAAVETGAPPPPSIQVTAPAGGENLASGSSYTVRWLGSAPSVVDSFVVYVSYDNFATPPIRLSRRNATQSTYGWLVPPGPRFDVRIRVVAYGKGGVPECSTSPAFSIGATVDAPAATAAAGLALAAWGNPGPAPVLVFEAPAGRPLSLAIHDVRGRRVRVLAQQPDGGSGRAAWDGRDDGGLATPPGVYFAVLDCAGARRTQTLVRLGR